jgi:uncharacterized RDD family membrane protein YckC
LAGALDTTTEIETPEHIRFRHRMAGPSRRLFAYLVDAMIRYGFALVVILCAIIGEILVADELGMASQGLILLVMFMVEWGYYVLCEALMSGRSPGKALLRLRVVSSDGHPLTISASMLRNLLRAADWLPGFYALGAAVMSRDRRFRRLGDLVAGTMVVVEERHRVEDAVQVYPPPTAEELAWFPERIPFTTSDIDAIELLLRRMRQLGPARANELAEIVVSTYARGLGYFGPIRDASRFLAVLYFRARVSREGGAKEVPQHA